MKRLGTCWTTILAAAFATVGCGGGGGGGSSGGGGGAPQFTAPPPGGSTQQTQTPTPPTTTTPTTPAGGGGVTGGSSGGGSSGGGSSGGGSSGGGSSGGGSSGGGSSGGGSSGGGGTTIPANYTQSADTRVVYVSNSEGSDTNSGLAPNAAKKTIAAGVALLRSGMPDWLLLKRGDTFTGGFGDWKKTGRSASEPMVVWSYGSGTTRPKLLTGNGLGLRCHGSSGTPDLVHSVAFVGFHLYAQTRDPDGGSFVGPAGSPGVHWLQHSRDIVFDDLKIESHTNGMNIQNFDGLGVDKITIRRCVIIDSYNNSAHSQAIFVSGVTNLVVEDSVFDKNGWNENVPGAEPTMFNHNLYLQYTNDINVVVRRNIITRASSHGLQLRSGGTVEDNFLMRNPIHVLVGTDASSAAPGAAGMVRNNVILEATDITEDLPRGWGICLQNLVSAQVQGNVVAHVLSSSSGRRSIEVLPFATYTGNKVFDWPVSSGKGWGDTLITMGPWMEPNRSMVTYMQSRGLPGTVDAFYQKIRAQSRDSFDTAFSATALNAYIRDGFTAP